MGPARKTPGSGPTVPPFVLAALLLMAFFVFRPLSALASYPVGKVRVEGLYCISEEELLYLLGISPGMDLSTGEATRGIKRAFRKGIFESISVESGAGGLIVVRVKERDFVDKMEVRGNENVSDSFVREHLGMQEHDLLRYDLLTRKQEALARALEKRGYPSATFTFQFSQTHNPHRIRVRVNLDEGTPLRVKRIDFDGVMAQDVRYLMKTNVGGVYDQFKLEEDLERIKRHYRKKGYIDPAAGPYSYEDGVLKVRVRPGRQLEVNIVGNESVSGKSLKGVLPFEEAGSAADEVVEEALSRILEVYHEEGYPSAQVAPVKAISDDVVRLNFYVYEGRKVLVDSIHIAGSNIEEKKIRDMMSLKERHAFNPALLKEDVERIRELYRALGYTDVSIAEPDVKILDSWATIKIEIEEGRQVHITEVNLRGVRSIPEKDILDALTIKSGSPYNDVDISDSRREILRLYRNRGFANCAVTVERTLTEKGAALLYRVHEGPRMFFGKTVVAGNRRTKPEVVMREAAYEEGQPFSQALLAETRQRLYKTGLFSNVEARPIQRKGSRKADVLIEVEEAKAGTVEFGVGYGEYERYRGFLEVGYINLFGMNRRVSARVEASTLSERYILNFQDPYFLGRALESRTLLLYEQRTEENIDTRETRYKLRRLTASTSLEKQFTPQLKGSISYEYSLVKTFHVQPGVILTREDTGTLGISSLTPSLSYDTRDNPFDPRRGFFLGGSLKVATQALLSETNFVKGRFQASGYQALARWLVLAASLRWGLATSFDESSELPLVERFFLGGRNTVRGFPQDELGPKGPDGAPTGGNAFVLGNLELRTHVTRNWRLVGFVDSGNVWVQPGDINPGDLRYTAGAGIQYNTPVGPIRVDYGYKLDREPGESAGEVHFSIGHAF
ncbi:MAG: outer membrane protein assembly factor BamA [Nitrospirota bacterium]